jgi:MFS family permease
LQSLPAGPFFAVRITLKPITVVTLLTLAMQGGHMGSRVVASLLALELGTGPMLIGVLIASYSIFQLGFALIVGRISDRYGSRLPMLGGTITFGAGLIIPAIWQTLPALFLSAPLIGVGFVFFNVAVQNLAGTLGTAAERTRNFSTLSLGYSSGHMIGPFRFWFSLHRLCRVDAGTDSHPRSVTTTRRPWRA